MPEQLNLHARLKAEFGQLAMKLARDWEKTERKIARYRNHLHFTLHCKHHGITPVSIKIKTSLKGAQVDRIVNRTQNALISVRVGQINHILQKLESDRADIDDAVFTHLQGHDTYTEVKNWVAHAHQTEWRKCRERQRKKFQNLSNKAENLPSKGQDNGPIVDITNTDIEAVKNRWVINKSAYTLKDNEESLLKKGLNFAVTPSTIPIHEYITGIETACKHIDNDKGDKDRLQTECANILKRAKLPKHNISKSERDGIKSLQDNRDIMILPADKGRATVILNTQDYKDKVLALLSDTKTYRKEKSDPTKKYAESLRSKLWNIHKSGTMDYATYRRLKPTGLDPPKFYGLPKVHKNNTPLRPIVACRGTPFYDTASYVAKIMNPLVGQSPHHLHNSRDMISRLQDIRVDDDEELISYDVTALFTSVPVEESINIIDERLRQDDTLHHRTPLAVEQVVCLLRACLTTTYFVYEGEFYTQTEGAAMGSPVSPIVANIFMEHFEVKALQSYTLSPPKLWGRYVDDNIGVLKRSQIEAFTSHLNSQHPAIKFTTESEESGTIPMLDVKAHRKLDGSLYFTVYRKPTHTEQYLQFDSHQPLEQKLGVIRTLRHRAETYVTNTEDKAKENHHLKKVLSISGYKKWTWDLPSTSARKSHMKNFLKSMKVKPKAHVTLPYVQGVSEALARRIRKRGIAVHHKPYTKLRDILVHPKDKTPAMDQSGVVYRIQCKDCQATYVGETERPLGSRVSEHKKDSKSVVHSHIQDTGHQVDFSNTKILSRESNWFRRGVKEAIHISTTEHTINRDRGRHQLPPTYKALFHSRESRKTDS